LRSGGGDLGGEVEIGEVTMAEVETVLVGEGPEENSSEKLARLSMEALLDL
jgi:ethanolamine ammonia-lyase small subunit